MAELVYEPVADDAPAWSNPHRLIRASAGSGKTYRLALRYLSLVRGGASPEGVLATTFTRKAAGEILGRVMGRLARAVLDEEERGRLSGDLGGATLTRTDAAEMLRRLAQSLHRLQVSTLDAFFHRVASAMGHELDLPPDATLAEANSPLAIALRLRAIEAMLGEAAADDEGFRTLAMLIRRLHHNSAMRSVTGFLDRELSGLHELYRHAPDPELWAPLKPDGLLRGDDLDSAVRASIELDAEAAVADEGGDRRCIKAVASCIAAVMGGEWDKLIDNGFGQSIAAGECLYYKKPIPPTIVAAMAPLVAHARAAGLAELVASTRAMRALLERFDAHVVELRRRARVLLFGDLTHLLARGLGESGHWQAVYERLDARVYHLLLDEFQDTSLEQWAILEPMAGEIASHVELGPRGDLSRVGGTATEVAAPGVAAGGVAAAERSLFVVGDVKQAIYGWRGGVAELFDEVEAMPGLGGAGGVGGDEGGGVSERLDVSWRSSPVVLEAVNRVFGSLGENIAVQSHEADMEAAASFGEAFEPHESAPPLRGLSGQVVMRTTRADDVEDGSDGDDEGDRPAAGHERSVAEAVVEISQRAPWASVGVLTRRNTAAASMLHAIRASGVPASGESGHPVTDAAAVEAVLAALTLADHPGDSAAAFHVANTPMRDVLGMIDATVEEAVRVSRDVRRSLLSKGYAATLTGWVRRLAASCDARELARLTQVVELAHRHDAQLRASVEPGGAMRPGRFVKLVEGTPMEGVEPARVRVMTVHRAKGLEFDAVVLAELDGRWREKPDVMVERVSPTGPVSAIYRYADKALRAQWPELERVYHAQRRASRREDLSELYVAMTRARRSLHLLVRPLSKTKTGATSKSGLSDASPAALLRQALRELEEEGFDGGEVLYERGGWEWAKV